MILKRMLKEEWRTQSKLYRGRYLAVLPVMIFLMTYIGGRVLTGFSLAPVTDLGLLISAFGFFTGLAAGSIGFSSKDAVENVLGDSNFLVFSSRTLPVRKMVLIRDFLVKDLVFYLGLYLGPVALGAVLVSSQLLVYTGYMMALFVAGLFLSVFTANLAVKIPSRDSFLNYGNFPVPPLSRKSVLDISRSSGGLLKIVMSMGVLLGLYWYIVSYVPIASYLLENLLMSFAVITGMMSVTVYNWLNTYDGVKDYSYLPVDSSKLLEAKFKAFKLVSAVIVAVVLSVAYMIYGGNLVLALAIGLTTAYYIGAITMYESGLNPNEKMINALVFSKFLIAVNILVMPLLALTSFQSNPGPILAVLLPMLVIGKVVESIKT